MTMVLYKVKYIFNQITGWESLEVSSLKRLFTIWLVAGFTTLIRIMMKMVMVMVVMVAVIHLDASIHQANTHISPVLCVPGPMTNYCNDTSTLYYGDGVSFTKWEYQKLWVWFWTTFIMMRFLYQITIEKYKKNYIWQFYKILRVLFHLRLNISPPHSTELRTRMLPSATGPPKSGPPRNDLRRTMIIVMMLDPRQGPFDLTISPSSQSSLWLSSSLSSSWSSLL